MADSGIENMADEASNLLAHSVATIEPPDDNGKLIEPNETDGKKQGTIITEGKAQVHYPGAEDSVFYNPVQEFNRDLR